MTAPRLTAEQRAVALRRARLRMDGFRGPIGDVSVVDLYALALLDATAERDRLAAMLAPIVEAARAYRSAKGVVVSTRDGSASLRDATDAGVALIAAALATLTEPSPR